MSLATSTPIRLTNEVDAALRSLHRQTKVNKSAILRLAIAAGLPIVMQQFGVGEVTKTRRTSAATESASRRSTPRSAKKKGGRAA